MFRNVPLGGRSSTNPGKHNLTTGDFGTPHVLVGARVLVDAADPRDVAAVNAVQDELGLDASSARPFVNPDYDQASLKATRDALLELAKGLSGFEHAFGAENEVDPVRHPIASAAGWGGLPDREATYLNVSPNVPACEYQLTVRDVPVDGFWSISLYTQRVLSAQRPRRLHRGRASDHWLLSDFHLIWVKPTAGGCRAACLGLSVHGDGQ